MIRFLRLRSSLTVMCNDDVKKSTNFIIKNNKMSYLIKYKSKHKHCYNCKSGNMNY